MSYSNFLLCFEAGQMCTYCRCLIGMRYSHLMNCLLVLKAGYEHRLYNFLYDSDAWICPNCPYMDSSKARDHNFKIHLCVRYLHVAQFSGGMNKVPKRWLWHQYVYLYEVLALHTHIQVTALIDMSKLIKNCRIQ